MGVLELNKAVSDAFSSGKSVVFLKDSLSLSGRVVLSEGVDTNLASHVELVCDGGSSDVKPIWVIRSQVLLACGLIVDGPLWNSNLVALLEELSVSLDEIFGWNILNGDSLLLVD